MRPFCFLVNKIASEALQHSGCSMGIRQLGSIITESESKKARCRYRQPISWQFLKKSKTENLILSQSYRAESQIFSVRFWSFTHENCTWALEKVCWSKGLHINSDCLCNVRQNFDNGIFIFCLHHQNSHSGSNRTPILGLSSILPQPLSHNSGWTLIHSLYMVAQELFGRSSVMPRHNYDIRMKTA